LKITVSFPVYLISITTFVGWFMLVIFLGSGLVALPIDLINSWRFRPIPMKEDEFKRCKHELASKVERLLVIGK
jgi:LMBR1 domain-containing protein 1